MPNFLVLQQELADRTNLDQTIAAQATRLQRWLNLAQQIICSRWPFDFLQQRIIVQTKIDRVITSSSGITVSVIAGNQTVTASSGTPFASTDKRSMIQFSGDTNWYEVTTYTSPTQIVVTPAVAITNATALYTLRTVYYDLPSDCFQVEDMRQTNTPAMMVNLGIWTMDQFQPDIQTTGIPTGYTLFRDDPDVSVSAAKQTQFSLFPSPDNVYNIEIRYFNELADLSSNTDIPMIPLPYHYVIIDVAEWLSSKFLNDPTEPTLREQAELGISKMIEMESSLASRLPVLRSSDDMPSGRFIRFPSNFEQPQ